MALLNFGKTHSRFAIICANGEGVPISFLLGNDGLAIVTSFRLSMRFWSNEDFMFIDEEVYDALLGDLIQTIGQSLVCDRDSKQWLLRPSRFQVYGVNDSLMTASMELVTSHGSSIGTI